MAVAEEERTTESRSGDEGHAGAALKAAGAAAATGAAAYAVQRALSNRSKNGSDDDGDSRREKRGKSGSGTGSLLASAASGGWDAARDTVMPLAEDAAGAAGKYLAEHAPDFVSEHIVPKFIEGFNEGRR